jgi:hypothetical protein
MRFSSASAFDREELVREAGTAAAAATMNIESACRSWTTLFRRMKEQGE